MGHCVCNSSSDRVHTQLATHTTPEQTVAHQRPDSTHRLSSCCYANLILQRPAAPWWAPSAHLPKTPNRTLQTTRSPGVPLKMTRCFPEYTHTHHMGAVQAPSTPNKPAAQLVREAPPPRLPPASPEPTHAAGTALGPWGKHRSGSSRDHRASTGACCAHGTPARVGTWGAIASRPEPGDSEWQADHVAVTGLSC